MLLSVLSGQFYITSVRKTVRAVRRACVFCRKLFARAVQQKMGQLPKERVTPSPPFTTTGIDFAGPFYTKRGAVRKPTLVKTYIALFICFATSRTLGSSNKHVSRVLFSCPEAVCVQKKTTQKSFRQTMGLISFLLMQTSKHCTRPWTNRSLSNRYPAIFPLIGSNVRGSQQDPEVWGNLEDRCEISQDAPKEDDQQPHFHI